MTQIVKVKNDVLEFFSFVTIVTMLHKAVAKLVRNAKEILSGQFRVQVSD